MTINPPGTSSSAWASDHGESTDAYPDGRACPKQLMNEVNLSAVMFNLRGEITDSRTPSPDRLGSKSDPSHYESDLLTHSGDRYRIRWKSIRLRDPSGGMVGRNR